MRVALSSLFRTAVDHLPAYFERVRRLEDALTARGDRLRLILSEGDSLDGTWAALQRMSANYDAVLVQRHHGGPYYGSVVNAERFWQLSLAANAAIELVSEDVDAWVFAECDLEWVAATVLRLVDHLAEVPCVAPLVIQDDRFYDSWAYRKDGIPFGAWPPYHAGLSGSGLVAIDSAGSLLAMRGDLARVCRFQPEDAIVGLCRDVYAHGGSVWLDQDATVRHPPYAAWLHLPAGAA